MKSVSTKKQRKAKIPTNPEEIALIEIARVTYAKKAVDEFVMHVYSKRMAKSTDIAVAYSSGYFEALEKAFAQVQRTLLPLSGVEKYWRDLRKIRRIHPSPEVVQEQLNEAYVVLLVAARMHRILPLKKDQLSLSYHQAQNRFKREKAYEMVWC